MCRLVVPQLSRAQLSTAQHSPSRAYRQPFAVCTYNTLICIHFIWRTERAASRRAAPHCIGFVLGSCSVRAQTEFFGVSLARSGRSFVTCHFGIAERALRDLCAPFHFLHPPLCKVNDKEREVWRESTERSLPKYCLHLLKRN